MTSERVTSSPPTVTFPRENVTRHLQRRSRNNERSTNPGVTFLSRFRKTTREQPIGGDYCKPTENVTRKPPKTLELVTSTTKPPGDILPKECHPEAGMSPTEVKA